MQENTTLAKRFWMVRTQLGLTKRDFGQAIGTSGTSINNIEMGTVLNPSFKIVSAVAEKFGINLHWLQFGDGDMFTKQASQEVSGNKIKGNSNSVGINSSVALSNVGADLVLAQREIENLNNQLKIKDETIDLLKERLKDKEEMIELLKKR